MDLRMRSLLAAYMAAAVSAVSPTSAHATTTNIDSSALACHFIDVWTKQTSPQIAAAFSADTNLQNTATDIECRGHMCRVQIDDTDRQVSPSRIASIRVTDAASWCCT